MQIGGEDIENMVLNVMLEKKTLKKAPFHAFLFGDGLLECMNNMNQNLCVFGDFKSRSWKLHVRIRIVLGPQNLYGEALVGPGTESRSAYLQIGT
jgi:hypothetical protein